MLALAAGVSVSLSAQAPPPAAKLTILSPEADSYLSGQTHAACRRWIHLTPRRR